MPSQPDTVTQISKVELPEWVDKASQANYASAEQIANKPFTPYSGQGVASMTPEMRQAIDYIMGSTNTGASQINDASSIFKSLGNFNYKPTSVKAGKLTDADLDAYLNPFTAEVEDKALGALDRQRQQALMQNADKAVAAKAFGGSRSAVVDAVTNAEAANSAGLLSADLRKQGYDRATALATADIDRKFAGDQFNSQAGLQAALGSAGVRQGAGQGLLSAASSALQKRGMDFMSMLQAGQLTQQQAQRELDYLRSEWDRGQNHDVEGLNLKLSALGMSPYGKTETTTKESNQGADWATTGLGILSLLPALFGLSDRRQKTDIKKLGRKNEFDLDLYSYRYKGDPKSYPKVVGPMAQDVEKKYPGSTIEVGGAMMVPRGMLSSV